MAVAHNLGFSLDGMTTANLDFQQQYRGRLNVLDRPGGVGVALTGHHELLIPLLHAAVVTGFPPRIALAPFPLTLTTGQLPSYKRHLLARAAQGEFIARMDGEQPIKLFAAVCP